MTEDPDLPPESIQLPIGHDLHWFSQNKVLDRGLSTIGNANPKSTRSSSSSKPKSLLQQKLKPPNGPILGLPNSAFHSNGSRPLPNLRIFPVNFSVERNPAVLDPESPKVSCFGRVLEERERKMCPVAGAGCWGNLSVFLGFAGAFPAVSSGDSEEFSRSEEERKPPELQGMKRFTSGRRAGSWVGDVDFGSDGHVVSLEPLDRECVIPRGIE